MNKELVGPTRANFLLHWLAIKMLAGGALDGTKWVSPVGATIMSRGSRRTLVLKPMNFQNSG
jgi:hypothetical protein